MTETIILSAIAAVIIGATLLIMFNTKAHAFATMFLVVTSFVFIMVIHTVGYFGCWLLLPFTWKRPTFWQSIEVPQDPEKA